MRRAHAAERAALRYDTVVPPSNTFIEQEESGRSLLRDNHLQVMRAGTDGSDVVAGG